MTAAPRAPAGLDASVDRARQHARRHSRRTAQRRPDKVRLIDGAVRLTSRELDGLIDRMAGALAERGLVKGDRLALLSHNR